MARDRSCSPAPLAGLLQSDGTVIVPPAIALEVLRALVRDITEQARSTSGRPSPAARQLLDALYAAAQQHTEPRPEPVAPEPDDQVPPGMSVREAADHMGCSVQYVRRLLVAGKLDGHKIGNTWVVR